MVGASLEVMDRDSKKMRGERPFIFSDMRSEKGIDEVIEFILKEGIIQSVTE